jgi:hypothetical protein
LHTTSRELRVKPLKSKRIAKVLIDRGVPVYGMSATVSEKVTELDSKFSFSYKYHTTDEITLKTIIRSNPGVLVLKEGVIVDKWHYNNYPILNILNMVCSLLPWSIRQHYCNIPP